MTTPGCPFDDPEAFPRRDGSVGSRRAWIEDEESADLRCILDQLLFAGALRRVPSGLRFSEIRAIAARIDRYNDNLRNYGVNSIADLRQMLAFGISNSDALPGQIGLLGEDEKVLLDWRRGNVEEPTSNDSEYNPDDDSLSDSGEEDTYEGELDLEEDTEENNEEKAMRVKEIVQEMGEIIFDVRDKMAEGVYLKLMNGLQNVTNEMNQ